MPRFVYVPLETQEIENKTTGKKEIVHTYGWYLRKYISDTKAAGATRIVLSNCFNSLLPKGSR